MCNLQIQKVKSIILNKDILFIVIILFLFITSSSAQHRQAAVIGDSIFQFTNYNKRIDTLQPISISIHLDSVYYDTCNWYNNSLDFEIKLLNNAKLAIYYKSEIYFWDDSGFGSERYQVGNMDKINPNTFGILKIHIRNTRCWHFNRQGNYTIFYNNKEVKVPISLIIQYTPRSCSMAHEERMKRKY